VSLLVAAAAQAQRTIERARFDGLSLILLIIGPITQVAIA
jgi:hypothetical protein